MTDEEFARTLIDASDYMVLATADEHGAPWASPVWFAHAGYREFLWVSTPDRRHSHNIAARPQVGIAIFDSTVAPGTGRGVYVEARAERLDGHELDGGLAVYGRRETERGLAPFTREELEEGARLRLYRAVATEITVSGPREDRIPVTLAG
jgi:nitroimidazol reductase NimA-like FMN-containing flavoprotein (pyridoxamine 5'-phosphate oxidase superfamily)